MNTFITLLAYVLVCAGAIIGHTYDPLVGLLIGIPSIIHLIVDFIISTRDTES